MNEPVPKLSDHFDGRKYHNLAGDHSPAFADVVRMIRTPRTPWPRDVPVEPRQPPSRQANEIQATFVGHSTWLLQTPAGNVLTDPVWSSRASPVSFAGPRRVRGPGIRFEELPAIDVVLLSHNHYDHCDLATLRRLQHRDAPQFIAPLGNGRLLAKAGATRVQLLDWWEDMMIGELRITATPAEHFSGRTLWDRNRALWCGYHLALPSHRILFAADTAYGPHFGSMRQRLGPVDLALIPIGAYEPRWFMRYVHMDPEEAVRAHVDLEARQSLAMHWGTFQLTPEGIDAPVQALAKSLADRGITAGAFRAIECGESVAMVAQGA
jgi:L-ascorbate metabolism protein UlaG (beta-lactamase superfamily)